MNRLYFNTSSHHISLIKLIFYHLTVAMWSEFDKQMQWLQHLQHRTLISFKVEVYAVYSSCSRSSSRDLGRRKQEAKLIMNLMHGSASNVVRTGRPVNGNRPKLTPYRSETPSPIKTKLNIIYFVLGNSSKAKTDHQPIKGAPPTKGQHIRFLLVFSFLCCSFLVTAPSKLAQGSALSGPNLSKNFQGVHFPTNPQNLGRE
jgi:hypothetical protein